MIITSSSTEIMAYTSRVALLFRQRNTAIGSLSMALDSRELRFYAKSLSSPSSSSSPISRASGDNKQQKENTDVFNPLSTTFDVRFPYADERVPARAHYNLLESGGNPASFSIYSNGIAGLMNSFDPDMKRTFATPGSPVHSRFASFASFTSQFINIPEDSLDTGGSNGMNRSRPGRDASAIEIDLTEEEEELFDLLRTVTTECGMKSTLRVAGGWVRDKILASKEFKQNRVSLDLLETGVLDATKPPEVEDEAMNRITSKFKGGELSVIDHNLCFLLWIG